MCSYGSKANCLISCVSEIDAGDILQMFGKMFFEFCQESGYDTILRVLGSNVREFLQVNMARFLGFQVISQFMEIHHRINSIVQTPSKSFQSVGSGKNPCKICHFVKVSSFYPSVCNCKCLHQNLDALHDHLGTIYPGMRAPSFRCTDAERGNNLILHYYSEREGLQDIVIGIIKTVAQQIHGTEIEMKVRFGALFELLL